LLGASGKPLSAAMLPGQRIQRCAPDGERTECCAT
jgi:hypothetical protein